MSNVTRLAILAGLALAGGGEAAARRDGAEANRPPRLEVLVIEVESCTICPLVKAQLLPRWQETAMSRRAPMRFVDVTRRDELSLGLTAPVDTVPTFVLLRDGAEIERISGYPGPANFIEVMGHALRRETGEE